MKLSFKKDKRATGLAGVAEPYPPTKIKADKGICGKISYSRDLSRWVIRLTVFKTEPDDNPNCPWKWITFKVLFFTESEARAWLDRNWPTILQKYTLYNQLGD